MDELARGERSLDTLIDRDRGLVLIIWLAEASDEHLHPSFGGSLRYAERSCGVAIDVAIERHDALIYSPPLSRLSFVCDGATRIHRAQDRIDLEYVDPPRLDRIAVTERALTAQARTEARAWVDAQVATLAGGECKETWP